MAALDAKCTEKWRNNLSNFLLDNIRSLENIPLNDGGLQADKFLSSQLQRVLQTEGLLLEATEFLLPIYSGVDKQCTGAYESNDNDLSRRPANSGRSTRHHHLTASEVAHKLQLLHDRQGKTIERILEVLNFRPGQSPSETERKPTKSSRHTFLFSTPLEPVVEADHETDGSLTTPGSASTRLTPHPLSTRTPASKRKQIIESRLPAITPSNGQTGKPYPHSCRAESSTLDNETFIESRILTSRNTSAEPTQEPSTISLPHEYASLPCLEGALPDADRVEFDERENIDYESDYVTDDDSALYCVTVKAFRPTTADPGTHETKSPLDGPNMSHIHVDQARYSLSATHLTMEDSYFSDQRPAADCLLSDLIMDDLTVATSVASQETAVLDRYRLDIDESSPYGFRVVPNQRGRHKKSTPPQICHDVPLVSTELQAPHFDDSGQRKEGHGSVIRERKSIQSVSQIDENTPLNDYRSTGILSKNRCHSTDTVARAKRANNLHLSKRQSIVLGDLDRRALTPRLGGETTETTKPAQVTSTTLVPISKDDYLQAPRIVQMQVTFQELECAVQGIESHLAFQDTGEFSEEQAYSLLSSVGFDKRKSKSLILSLCHFRRIRVQKSSYLSNNQMFAVVSFAAS